MFTHVMNLTMNAAIFRPGTPADVPRRATPKKTKAGRQRSNVPARIAGASRVPAAVQIYADAFRTAVYGG